MSRWLKGEAAAPTRVERDPTMLCAKIVYESFHSHRCPCKGVVERKGLLYCKQHDPEAVAARRVARDAKWQAEWDAQDKAQAHAKAIREVKDDVVQAARELISGVGGVHALRDAVVALNVLEFPDAHAGVVTES